MDAQFEIVAYDENFLYMRDGSKITPPEGCKFDVDIIKKIIEAGEPLPNVNVAEVKE